MNDEPFGLQRLTRRPLPLDDASVDILDPAQREAVATMWANRAAAELHVAATFTLIATDLFAIGADPAVLAIASRAPGEEVRHAEICRRTATRYRGSEVPWPTTAPASLPQVAEAPTGVRVAMHMVGMCCLNETITSAFLQACLDAAESPLARATLGELLADEIDHGRLGWAYLASSLVTDEVREQVRRRFVPLRDATLRLWATQNRSPLADGVPAHGLLSHAAIDSVVTQAIDALVVPGLVSVGVRV